MIFALRKDPTMCLSGRFYEHAESAEGEYFEYAQESDKTRSRDTSVRNLVIQEGTLTIRTNWDIPFRPGTYVLLSDGNTYMIESTLRAPASTSYQSLAVCSIPDQDWLLQLRLVANLRGDVL